MYLPRISRRSPHADRVVQFLGYHGTEGAAKGEFIHMENMSSRRFPHLSPRKPRGTVRTLTHGGGFCIREKMLWAEGTSLFWDGKQVATLTEGEKTFLSFGAYVLIFPDKQMFHTLTEEVTSMEAAYTAAGTVTYEQAWLTDDESDPTGQVYVKIGATGIGRDFETGDGVRITGFGEEALNGTHVVQERGDDHIKIIAAIEQNGSQMGGVKIERKIPDCDFWTVAENRLWGCSSKHHEIYGSALGNPKNFYNYSGGAESSYAVTIANDGDFTGAITYLGYVMFFKENSVHKLYGNKPSNFQVVEGQLRGVARGSHKSMEIVNEVLYYLSPAGVMSFQGSIPYPVGAVLGEGWQKGVAGSVGDRYYLSMEKNGEHHLFVYDTALGLWHREDSTKADCFYKDGDTLYFLADDKIQTTEGAEEGAVEWLAETAPYQTAKAKFISRILLRAEVPQGASLTLWVEYDSLGDWQRVGTLSPQGRSTGELPLIPRRCDHFRLRFGGVGDCVVQDMTLFVTEGSTKRKGGHWQ